MRSLTIIIIIFSAILAYAGENSQELAKYYPNQNLKVDIDWDDENETIRLSSGGVDDEDMFKQAYIVEVIENGDYVSSLAVLVDSWQLVYLFTVEVYPTVPPYIAVGYTKQGEVPYSIDLLRYKDRPGLRLSNLTRVAHFESDVGSIVLKDIDGDDIKEIIVKNSTGDNAYKYIDADKWEKLLEEQ